MTAEKINLTDEQKELLKRVMYRLDWIKILDTAIKMRPSSWRFHEYEFEGKKCQSPPVTEWRNASDEICNAVIRAMEEAGVMVPLFKEREKT